MIKNYDYYMRASSGLCGDAKHIKLWITNEDNTTIQLYYKSKPATENNTLLVDRFLVKKVKSIHFSSFIHEEDSVGWCNGHTASVSDNKDLVYNNGIATGSISLYDNGGNQAIIDVEFDYEVVPVEKNYNYKVEYNIDLYNQSTTPFMNFENYTGNYILQLTTGVENKTIYNQSVFSLVSGVSIKNTKYDSIVRFKDALTASKGRMNVRFRSNSMLKCEDQVEEDFGNFSYIDATENSTIRDPGGCMPYKYLFPMCSTAEIQYFNIYRIHKDLFNIEKNKGSFVTNNPELKICEPFRVYVNDCNETSSYAVEYSTDNLNFKTLLPYARRESYFDLDYAQLEGTDIQTVKIRIKYYNSGNYTTHPYLYSEATSFTVFPCPPKLVDEPEPIRTRCSYTSDGSFKINFDRQLINEKLIISVYFKNFDSGDFEFYKQEDTLNLVDNGNGTYSYTWLGLNDGFLDPVEEYKVKYQALRDVRDSLPHTDQTWSSANESREFTVPIAKPIQFIATKLNDESCFDRRDGRIRLEITQGEEGRTYYYQIKKDEKLQVFNGTSWNEYLGSNIEETWVPFVESDSTVINKLDKGSYKIKVRDSYACYAKE
ncbi:hypothetical protein SLH33_00900 [Tenacibaculum sp. IB213877]|nr:hypothetical protein [Tenacibaculum sp. IB213877]